METYPEKYDARTFVNPDKPKRSVAAWYAMPGEKGIYFLGEGEKF